MNIIGRRAGSGFEYFPRCVRGKRMCFILEICLHKAKVIETILVGRNR